MSYDNRSIKFTELQLEAINSSALGRLKIVAGAGSGKTEVLINRIINLYKIQNISPKRIVGITYTKKAASEIKQRIFERTNDNFPRDLIINTFHGFLTQLILKDPFIVELTGDEKIITEFDQKLIFIKIKEQFEKIFVEMFENIDPDLAIIILDELPELFLEMRRYILKPSEVNDFLKNAKINRSQDYTQSEKFIIELLYKFYAFYRQFLYLHNYIDFDEILIKAKEYLQSEFVDKSLNLPDVFLIDEFQDNNFEQMELIENFLNRSANSHITVVGDFRQSIFRFQGADVNAFMHFKPTKEIILYENFRSSKEIVDLASHVFCLSNFIKNNNIDKNYLLHKSVKGNSSREYPIAMVLHTFDKSSNRNQFYKHDAEIIATIIKNLVSKSLFLSYKKRPIKYSDIAIIVPSVKYLPSAYEDALTKHEIPYLVTGSIGFYGRSEISEIISFFKILIEPNDDISLLKVLTGPIFGLKDSELVAIFYQDFSKNQIEELNKDNQTVLNQIQYDSIPLWIKLEKFYNKLSKMQSQSHKLNLCTYTNLFQNTSDNLSKTTISKETFNSEIESESLIKKIEHFFNFYKKLQLKSLTSGIVDLLYFIIEEGGYKEYIAGIQNKIRKMQYEANLLKLFTIARNFEKSGVFSSLRDFLKWYEEIKYYDIEEEEAEISIPDSDAVSLLTIHKAKGLEFPMVILPNLSKKKFRENRCIRFNKKFGVVAKFEDLQFDKNNIVWENFSSLEKEEHNEEEIRKLYVAITRASELLLITGLFPENQNNSNTKTDEFIEIISQWIKINSSYKFGKIYTCKEIDLLCSKWLGKNDDVMIETNESFKSINNAQNGINVFESSLKVDETGKNNSSLASKSFDINQNAYDNSFENKISFLTQVIDKIYYHYYQNKETEQRNSFNFDISCLSIQDLEYFEECPRKFYLNKNNIIGFIENNINNSVNIVSHIPISTAIGNLFHLTLKVAYNKDLNLSNENEIYKLAEEIATKLNESRVDVINQTKSLLKSFINSELAQVKPISIEKEINLLINLDFECITKKNNNNQKIYIKGFIDRIDKVDNIIRIIDFKTSFNIKLVNKYKRQLSFYEAYIKDELNYQHLTNPTELGCFVARIDAKNTKLIKIDTSAEEFLNWAKIMVTKILSEKNWYKVDNKESCNKCLYKIFCS